MTTENNEKCPSLGVVEFLPDTTFRAVIENAPLVSIDLVVRNATGMVLLGRRINRPAQGSWFVPGGRVRKNEYLSQAFSRLAKEELGITCKIEDAVYLGLYEHFYQDSIYTKGSVEVSTHYIVNCFEVRLDFLNKSFPIDQHNQYSWFSESELLVSPDVHMHTKWYFERDRGFK